MSKEVCLRQDTVFSGGPVMRNVMEAGMVLFMAVSIMSCNTSGKTSAESSSSKTFLNSIDADGFLWGTEGNVNTANASDLPSEAAAAVDAINNTLGTKYVKFRISAGFLLHHGRRCDLFRTILSAQGKPMQCFLQHGRSGHSSTRPTAGAWSPCSESNETQTITTELDR